MAICNEPKLLTQEIPGDPPLPSPTGNSCIWLRVGALVDGISDRPIENANIVYDSQAIRFVGDSSTLPPTTCIKPGQQEPDLELPDHTLLPGLIEAHAHLFLEGGELDFDKRKSHLQMSSQQLLEAAYPRLERLVQLGIIAVRDAGDKNGVGLALSKLNKSADKPLMPHIDSPGAAIHRKGRYGSFMAEPLEDYETAKACVQARVDAGADRIKLIPTGIIDFEAAKVTKEPQMNTEELTEFVQAARRLEKQTFAHASGDDGIEHTVEAGVDSVEHGFFIRDDQLSRMRDRNIAWVPTIAPVQRQIDYAEHLGWDDRIVSNLSGIIEQHSASLVKACAMGVRVIAGSDAGSWGVAHGDGLLYELELMERAGLSAIQVLNSATGQPTHRLTFGEKFGLIRPGFRSRFILTQYPVLEGISNLRQPKHVIFDGKLIESPANVDLRGL